MVNKLVTTGLKIDHLFDLRLDGELDHETFDTKRIVLTETNLSYELNFPFELFETTKPRKGRLNATELVKHRQNKALEQIDSKNEQIANNNSHELQISHKKQEVKSENLTSVQSGWRRGAVFEVK